MSKTKINTTDIEYIEQDWENYSGEKVQEFIKSYLSNPPHIIEGGIAIYKYDNNKDYELTQNDIDYILNYWDAELYQFGTKDGDNLNTTIPDDIDENLSDYHYSTKTRFSISLINPYCCYIIVPRSYTISVTSSNNESLTSRFEKVNNYDNQSEINIYRYSIEEPLGVNATVTLKK